MVIERENDFKGVITLKIIIKVKLFRGREGKIEEKE